MFPSKYLAIIRILAASLVDSGVVWALTGSTSFALQGLPIDPKDIDVQTDQPGVFEIQDRFRESVVRPVEFSSTGKIRSFYGALEVQGIPVEIMGDVQKRLPDGSWSSVPDIPHLRRIVRLDELEIPVLDLAYEVEAYELMGRPARAEQIRRWLAVNSVDDPE